MFPRNLLFGLFIGLAAVAWLITAFVPALQATALSLLLILLNVYTGVLLAKWLGYGRSMFMLILLASPIAAVAMLAPLLGIGFELAEGWSVLPAVLLWPVLIAGGMTLARRITRRPGLVIIVSTLLVAATSSVVEPIALLLGWWSWPVSGVYYGAPWWYFFGWIGMSAVGSILFFLLSGNRRPPGGLVAPALVLVLFLGFMHLYLIHPAPAVISLGMTYLVFKHDRQLGFSLMR